MNAYLKMKKNMHFWSYKLNLYSRLRNRCTPMFIKLSIFFQGPKSYCELNYYTSLNILSDYIYYFPQIFQRRLFKGLCLFRTLEYIKNMASICNGMDKLMNEKKIITKWSPSAIDLFYDSHTLVYAWLTNVRENWISFQGPMDHVHECIPCKRED